MLNKIIAKPNEDNIKFIKDHKLSQKDIKYIQSRGMTIDRVRIMYELLIKNPS